MRVRARPDPLAPLRPSSKGPDRVTIAEFLNMDPQQLVAALDELQSVIEGERQKMGAMMEAEGADPHQDRLHELSPVGRIPVECFYRHLFGGGVSFLQAPGSLPDWTPRQPTTLFPFTNILISTLHAAVMQVFRLGVGYGRRVPLPPGLGELTSDRKQLLMDECPKCMALWRSDGNTESPSSQPHYASCEDNPQRALAADLLRAGNGLRDRVGALRSFLLSGERLSEADQEDIDAVLAAWAQAQEGASV